MVIKIWTIFFEWREKKKKNKEEKSKFRKYRTSERMTNLKIRFPIFIQTFPFSFQHPFHTHVFKILIKNSRKRKKKKPREIILPSH